uniref:C2H2-type domain-containing protein n=1 Tax=Macrostomum lignano TaxID=282301 RepID=A0A1I8FCQ3_9PLAT
MMSDDAEPPLLTIQVIRQPCSSNSSRAQTAAMPPLPLSTAPSVALRHSVGSFCDSAFRKKVGLQRHLDSCPRQIDSSPACRAVTPRCPVHRRGRPRTPRAKICLRCLPGAELRQAEDLRRHQLARHAPDRHERPFAVSRLFQTFLPSRAALAHMAVHSAALRHSCNLCPAALISGSNLRVHLVARCMALLPRLWPRLLRLQQRLTVAAARIRPAC